MTPGRARAVELARERDARSHRGHDPFVDRYPAALDAALAHWGIEVDEVFGSGAGLPVLGVVDPGGVRAVLKLDAVGRLDQQARVMTAARGHGYARVLGWEQALGALLLERLGADLWAGGLAVPQIVATCGTLLTECWRVPRRHGEPERKAAGLGGIVARLGPRFGAGHEAALRAADAIARDLARTEQAEVVCHGDPHPQNALRRGDGYAYVDPDGFLGERAYDLGVIMRDFVVQVREREAGRPGAGRELIEAGCEQLAAMTGVDPERIWRWALVERVTTGLYLGWFGYPDEAAGFLGVADALVAG